MTLLTPPGRGALAVVGVAGPDACHVADRCFRPHGGKPLSERGDAAICFGSWRSDDERAGEDLVVVKHTLDHIEVHCHGGLAASEAVMASLERHGACRQAWPEWLADNGVDLIEIEARDAMSRVAGARAARILARQSTALLRDELARLATLPASDRTAGIERLLAASRIGLRLTDPWRVVLAGPVNAGKSSLANAIAGYARSIVSPEPGTTRDIVSTRLVLGGFDVELFDTAGLRETNAAISSTERAGIARAQRAADEADLVLRVIPANEAGSFTAERADLVVLTKADLAPVGFTPPSGVILTSVVTGLGMAETIDAIVARLVPEVEKDPTLLEGSVPFTQRQVSQIRENER